MLLILIQPYPIQAQTPPPQRTRPVPKASPVSPPTSPDGEVIEDDVAPPDEEAIDDEEEPSTETRKLPSDDPNPLNRAGDSLDTLVEQGISADLWEQMRGDLPCVDATKACIAQLQETATQHNPLLVEIDTRIEEISSRIEEAKAQNKKSVRLSVLRPAVRVLLDPVPVPGTDPNTTIVQSRPQPLAKIAQIFTSPVRLINEVLAAVGIPLFDSFFGGSDQNQERAIAISELEIQLAQIQRGRAELADQVKEKVSKAVFDFDTSRREFQISNEVSRRESTRIQLTQVEYRVGGENTESYLSQLSSLDRQKASTWRAWSTLRSQLEKIRLLVLGTD